MTSCQKNETEEVKHTLDGTWSTDKFTVLESTSKARAAEMEDYWEIGEVYFVITNKLHLYVCDKYGEKWPVYVLQYSQDYKDSDGTVLKRFYAKSDSDYPSIMLYWNVEKDKLTCIGSNYPDKNSFRVELTKTSNNY